MSTNRMLTALARQRGLRLVGDPETSMMGQDNTVRLDGWQNNVTGLGTSRDKTSYNEFVPGYVLGDWELSALYHGNDLAARMVDVVPDEMFREGFDVDVGDPKLNAELADQIEALGLVAKLADAVRWGRLFGAGGVLLGADDGRSASAPLDPEKAQSLSYVYVVDRRYLWPLTYYRDAGHPKLGQPETFMVTSPSSWTDSPVAVVHETRLVLFGGATTGIRERESNQGWDYSVLQRPNKVLGDFDLGWQSVLHLLSDGNQAVFKMSGLAEAIGSPGQEELLTKRLQAMDLSRSIVRAIVIDAGESNENAEEFTRQVFPLTGIPDTLDKLMLRLSAAVQIPVTILMGQSPAGMNATGESDFRWFYDRIKSEQTRKLTPKIRRIVQVMLATKRFSKLNERGAIVIKFPPLWSETPLARAQTRKTVLEADAMAIDKGMILPEEAALKRFQPDGFESEIALSPEGIKAREAALKIELERLEEGPPDPLEEVPPTDDEDGDGKGGPPSFGKGGGASGGFPKGSEARADGFDPDQPRDELGRFGEGGGGSGGSPKAERHAKAVERKAAASERVNRTAAEKNEADAKWSARRAEIEQSFTEHEQYATRIHEAVQGAHTEVKTKLVEAKTALKVAKAEERAKLRDLNKRHTQLEKEYEAMADDDPRVEATEGEIESLENAIGELDGEGLPERLRIEALINGDGTGNGLSDQEYSLRESLRATTKALKQVPKLAARNRALVDSEDANQLDRVAEFDDVLPNVEGFVQYQLRDAPELPGQGDPTDPSWFPSPEYWEESARREQEVLARYGQPKPLDLSEAEDLLSDRDQAARTHERALRAARLHEREVARTAKSL